MAQGRLKRGEVLAGPRTACGLCAYRDDWLPKVFLKESVICSLTAIVHERWVGRTREAGPFGRLHAWLDASLLCVHVKMALPEVWHGDDGYAVQFSGAIIVSLEYRCAYDKQTAVSQWVGSL